MRRALRRAAGVLLGVLLLLPAQEPSGPLLPRADSTTERGEALRAHAGEALRAIREARVGGDPDRALGLAQDLLGTASLPEDLRTRARWELARSWEQLRQPAPAEDAYGRIERGAQEPRLALRALERRVRLLATRSASTHTTQAFHEGLAALERRFAARAEDLRELHEAAHALLARRPEWRDDGLRSPSRSSDAVR